MTTGVSTRIDQDLCTGCGDCIAVCPARTLALVDGKAQVVGDRSLHCGHCAAACPVGAVEVTAIDPAQWRFDTFTLDERWLPRRGRAAGDPEHLARLPRHGPGLLPDRLRGRGHAP